MEKEKSCPKCGASVMMRSEFISIFSSRPVPSADANLAQRRVYECPRCHFMELHREEQHTADG